MAAAVEEMLGERVAAGLVVVKHGHTHPPGRSSCARRRIRSQMRAASTARPSWWRCSATTGPRDLVIVVLSGGGSALMLLPAEGISLADMQQTTDVLLRAGATINELNTIRKHLEQAKGGGLARLAAPSDVLALVLSDVVGNPLDVIASGPTVPDTSTFADTCAIVDRFGIWERLPASVAGRLRDGRDGQDRRHAEARRSTVRPRADGGGGQQRACGRGRRAPGRARGAVGAAPDDLRRG